LGGWFFCGDADSGLKRWEIRKLFHVEHRKGAIDDGDQHVFGVIYPVLKRI
jgi:hypothetical protein